MAEGFGVEGRGRFYEEAGAIRDVIQNHMLQIVGLLGMEAPSIRFRDSVREEQIKLFRSIRPLSPEDLVCGQFRGYLREKGVAQNSRVETYAAVRLHIDSWRWEGVPFFIRSGKCLPVTATEVLVTLKRPPLNLAGGATNYVRFRLSPDVVIAIGALVKRAGAGMGGEPVELKVVHNSATEIGAYERLLTDAMAGDTTLFGTQAGVEAQWAIVQPVLGIGEIHEYEPGSWGPGEAERLVSNFGGWHCPPDRQL